MMDIHEIERFLRKQEAVIWNLSELIRTLTYRQPQYRSTKKEGHMFCIVDDVLLQIQRTSHPTGPEGEEYMTWDRQEPLLKELYKALGI